MCSLSFNFLCSVKGKCRIIFPLVLFACLINHWSQHAAVFCWTACVMWWCYLTVQCLVCVSSIRTTAISKLLKWWSRTLILDSAMSSTCALHQDTTVTSIFFCCIQLYIACRYFFLSLVSKKTPSWWFLFICNPSWPCKKMSSLLKATVVGIWNLSYENISRS